MTIDVFPERVGDFINFNAISEESEIMGVMCVEENDIDIQIHNIVVFPRFDYEMVADALFSELIIRMQEEDGYKALNITYELNNETLPLQMYLRNREDFILNPSGTVFTMSVDDLSKLLESPTIKSAISGADSNVKLVSELNTVQKNYLAQKLFSLNIATTKSANDIDNTYDTSISFVGVSKDNEEITTGVMASFDGENTLYLNAAFLTNDMKILFMQTLASFIQEACKKYRGMKLVLTSVNEQSESLCNHFAELIENVTREDVIFALWTGFDASITKDPDFDFDWI